MGPCKDSGYSIVTADGKVIKLDDKGVQLAIATLEASDKEKDLQVKADGKLSGDMLAVTSIELL